MPLTTRYCACLFDGNVEAHHEHDGRPNELRSARRKGRDRRESRLEARGDRHSRFGCRPREEVLPAARMATRCRLRVRQRLPRRPAHAARLGVLDPVRDERHRRCTRRARCTWRRSQRGLPRGDARCSAPARGNDGSRSRRRARSRELLTARRPGRVERNGAAFSSASDLAGALRRAEAAHGEHERRTGQRDKEWADRYAAYMVADCASR